MKAVRIHEFGDESVLRYEDAPDPEVGANDVLIKVKAAALNRSDLLRRAGSAGAQPLSWPIIPGLEAAGIVEAVGPRVDNLTVGQRVVAFKFPSLAGYTEMGAYAELVAVPAGNVYALPDSVSFEEAATIPAVFMTCWYALVRMARLQSDETVLIHSAGSGVGVAGIEIAKYIGARIIATAGGDAKVQKARELGVDFTINYNTQDFVAEVWRVTVGRGVDVVLDPVGGQVLRKSVDLLAYGGRLLVLGNASQAPAPLDITTILRRSLSLYGLYLGADANIHQQEFRQEMAKVLALFGRGKLHSIIDRAFPLSEAAAAHRYLAQRQNFGKVVLVP